MWQVLRRYQNEEYKTVEEAEVGTLADGSATYVLPPNIPSNDTHPNTTAKYRFELSMRQISLHETKPDPKPLDPLVLTTPFDRLVYGKLARTLEHENVGMRRSAIEQLLELYSQKREHVVMSIKLANILDVLCVSLNDPDEEIRANACRALAFVMSEAEGQKVALGIPQPTTKADGTTCKGYNYYYFEKFLSALDDEDPLVVAEALKVLEACHMQHNDLVCTKHLIKLNCMTAYVSKIKVKHEGVCGNACSALARALDVKESFIFALDAGAMEALTHVMAADTDPFVLTKAAEATTKLAFYEAGKRAAVKYRTLAAVLPHILDENAAVRTAIAGALAALTVYVPGRQQALELHLVEELASAINAEEQRDVLANHMHTICNMAEHPQARFALRATAIARLEEIVGLTIDYPELRESAVKAIKVITWVPGEQ